MSAKDRQKKLRRRIREAEYAMARAYRAGETKRAAQLFSHKNDLEKEIEMQTRRKRAKYAEMPGHPGRLRISKILNDLARLVDMNHDLSGIGSKQSDANIVNKIKYLWNE